MTSILTRRSLAALALMVLAGSCTSSKTETPTKSAPPPLVAAKQGLFDNPGLEDDLLGAVPSNWVVTGYQNDQGGLSAVPPLSFADVRLRVGGPTTGTYVVGGLPESQIEPSLGATASLRLPKFGNRALTINNRGSNYASNAIRQTATLTSADVDPIDSKIHIRFIAAPVLQVPAHTANQQPYYFIQVRNVTTNAILHTDFSYAGQPGVPWKQINSLTDGQLYYTDWQLADITPGDLASLGDQIEMLVIASGCSQGGHWGHVYTDAFATDIPGLFVTGTGPSIAPNNSDISYLLTYRNGGSTPVDGAEITFNTPPGTVFMSTSGTSLACSGPASGSAGAVGCVIGTLASGASGSITVTVRINPGVTGSIVSQNYFIVADGVTPLIGNKVVTATYAAPASLSLVSGTPQTTVVGTTFGAAATVVVRDATNTVLQGIPVQFSAPTSGASATASRPIAITAANGNATVNVTANSVAGSYQLSASSTLLGIGGVPVAPVIFALTNRAGAAASLLVLDGGSPQSTSIGSAFSAPLVVTVKDQFGNAISGAAVTFSAPSSGASASLSAASVTNAQGATQVDAVANTVAGSYLVTAQVSGVTTPAVFSLTNLPGVPASIAVVNGNNQTPTVGSPFAADLVVVVRDASNNPVPNVTVAFTSPSSGAGASLGTVLPTNSAGKTQVTAAANTVSGAYTILASVAAVTSAATFNASNLPGSPASVAVVGSSSIDGGAPQSAPINTAFANPLVVQVADQYGNPVPGVAVAFAGPSSGASARLTSPALTNASGQTQVVATANAFAGRYSVNAAVSGVADPASFALTNTFGPPASLALVSGSAQTAAAGSAFAAPLVVVVRDVGNNPVSGAMVSFTATPSLQGASAALSAPAITDAAGQTEVAATANTIAGDYAVTASTAGVASSVRFTLSNTSTTPAAISFSNSPQSTVVLSAFAQPLVMTVLNNGNQPLSGIAVTLAAPTTGASATFTGSQTTDTRGQISIVATANRIAGGPYSITASAGSVSDSVTLTNLPGSPASLVVVDGGVQSTEQNTPFAQPLVVAVADAEGNAVPNVTVVFTPPTTAASARLSASTVSTGPNGQASTSATATDSPGGPYSVIAQANGLASTATFSLTNVPRVPTQPVISLPVQNAQLQASPAQIQGTAEASIPLRVYADGNTTLPLCTTVPSATGTWNCAPPSPLPDGPHVLIATSVNATAMTSSLPQNFSIDSLAPAPPVVIAPAEGATTSPSPTISGTSELGTIVRLFVDGSPTAACSAQTNANGNFTCVASPPLGTGAHTVVAIAVDAAGNASPPTPVRGFNVAGDARPDAPTIDMPVGNGAVSDSTPTISGQTDPLAEVRVFVDGIATPVCVTTASASGAWSCDTNRPLADGPHSLVASATTASGTSAPSPLTRFVVDTSTPRAPTINEPMANATTSPTPVYVGTSESNARVAVFVDGNSVETCIATSNSNGLWSCADSTRLTAGPHALIAIATSRADNISQPTISRPFNVAGGQPPANPVVLRPAANAALRTTLPLFAGVAEPNSTVELLVDDNMGASCTSVAAANGQFSCVALAALMAGPHQVAARATNAAGVRSTSEKVPFTIDLTAPVSPTVSSPIANQQTGRTPVLAGTAEADSVVTVRVDGQVVCEVAAPNGMWSCPVSQPLNPGPRTVTARSNDSAGNSSATTSPVPFMVLPQPAQPVIISPANGMSVMSPTPEIRGSGEPNARVVVRIDGNEVCVTMSDAMGRFACVPSMPLSEGPHLVSATATTAGGSARCDPNPFSVGPSAPIIRAPAQGSRTSQVKPMLAGEARADSLVSVSVDGSPVCEATATAQGRFECAPTSPLSVGIHQAMAQARNANGSSASSAPVDFWVVAPPAVTAPASDSQVSQSPTFKGTAQPNATVSVRVDDAQVCSAQADSGGAWSCRANAPLKPGMHSVVALDVEDTSSNAVSFRVVQQVLEGYGIGTGCSSTSSGSRWVFGLLLALWFGVRKSRHLRRAGAAAVASLIAATASAQETTPVPGFDLERVRLNSAAAQGLLIESADLLPQFGYRIALTLHYQRDPLVLSENGKRVAAVVSDRLGVHVSGAFSFTDWLDVSLQMPIVLMQAGQDVSDRGYSPIQTGVAAGTPWVAARVAPWQQKRDHAVDFSIGVAVGLPIGSTAALTRDTTVTVIPSIAIGRTLNSWLRIGGGVNAFIRGAQTLTPATTVRDEIGSVISPSVILSTLGDGLRGELSSRFDIPLTRSGFGAEIDLGLRYPLFNLLEVYAVGGPGFSNLPGTPTFRVLAGLAVAPRPPSCAGQSYDIKKCPNLDLDGDGILNAADQCPTVAGLAQRQGCGDTDTDKDGVLDLADACVNVAGLAKLGGCPDRDADNDGIADSADACPSTSGVVSQRGCPEPDSDGDGLADSLDACPQVSGLKERKGCPESDADKDGIADRFDNCISIPGVKENGGCPAQEKRLATLDCGRIATKEKVYFQTAKAKILPKSDALLSQILQILNDHPELSRITIGGHTDARGSREYNRGLSKQRADSVRQWLVEHGVVANRLSTEGFGPDQPVASNANEQGREQNRRVEFVATGAECAGR